MNHIWTTWNPVFYCRRQCWSSWHSFEFNSAIRTHSFPLLWKEPKIFRVETQLYLKTIVQIYILSNFLNVFVIVIYDYTYPYVYTQISTYQHQVNHIVFLKVFDRNDHSILYSKLIGFGLSRDFYENFRILHNSVQYVFYNGYRWNIYVETSGIPQGSNFGPFIFTFHCWPFRNKNVQSPTIRRWPYDLLSTFKQGQKLYCVSK